MSEHTDKIRAKILDHIPSMVADDLGHKFGTMHHKGQYQRVCINCGCAIGCVKAQKPCEGAE